MTSEEIKARTSMPDVISGIYHIQIRNNMCRCPFHDDKSPSMRVYADSAYCFTCGKQWDVFSFVQDMDGCGFKDAFISLGGTYERHDTELARFKVEQERKRKRAETERKQKEERRRFFEVAVALLICQTGIKLYEPLSDEWCFFQNELPVIQWLYEEIFLNQTMEYDIDVHRRCERIKSRGLQGK